jgi:predicted nucleotidyltransferase
MNEVVAPIQDAELRRIVDVIVANFAPSRIVLFGSQARGDARPDSDIDLLVVMPDGTHRRRTGQAIYEALRMVRGRSRGVDLVVVTDTEFDRGADDLGTVIRAAFREGRLLARNLAVPVG